MKKYRFNVELELTERELEILLDHAGIGKDEELKNIVISDFADKPSDIIKRDNSFIPNLLMADDFNEVLSFGLYAYSKMDGDVLKPNERTYGEMQIKRYEIENISGKLVELEPEYISAGLLEK